eukprot:5305906-Amphidinium_carterae.1
MAEPAEEMGFLEAGLGKIKARSTRSNLICNHVLHTSVSEYLERLHFPQGILAYSTMPLVDEDGRLPDEGDPGALFLAASDS